MLQPPVSLLPVLVVRGETLAAALQQRARVVERVYHEGAPSPVETAEAAA